MKAEKAWAKETIISPILTYNSEAWGLYTKQDFKT